ncbi:MerR family transcriptional regulator [Thomasclavelia ramosa]|uniref:MerR family transcriptional regulator n=2 Tax=Coprobacillaceae TaxID=2810280 RepID=UPI003002226C
MICNKRKENECYEDHEVEEWFHITKKALIYYEKVGLIKPDRDDNDYRNYSQSDADSVKLIVFLRSMKISLEEIKKSIYQCIADGEKDGRYNHVAFVVASGSKISSGYDDVTIAQHTSNCCARVTSFVTGLGNTSAV